MEKCSRLDRIVARVAGDDPVAFLDATTTQDFTGTSKGDSVLTCMLDEKGRVQADMRATLLDDGTVLLDAEQPARDAITGWLAKIAPLSGCEIADESEGWVVTALFGTHEQPADTIALDSRWGASDLDVLCARDAAFEGDEMSSPEYEAARIVAGRPRFGVDFDGSTHIAETPLIARAVSFTKGCYPGQESVARVHNLGHVRKRLVGLDIARDDAPPVGGALDVDGEVVGRITSAARWKERVVAIAFLRSDVEDDAAVNVAGSRATVRAL